MSLRDKQIEQASKILSELTGVKFTTDDIKIIEKETKEVIKMYDIGLAKRLENDNNFIFGCSSGYPFFNIYITISPDSAFRIYYLNFLNISVINIIQDVLNFSVSPFCIRPTQSNY